MIVHQPFFLSLGDEIIKKLNSGDYDEFRFIVAYAKTSGVNRLLPSMLDFKNTGGKILGIVGIDQFNTSYEALKSLNNICDELYIYHSENLMKTFHVKAYSFKGASENWIAVGSNNLTAGGLFSNYEACMCKCTDDPEEEKMLMQLFSSYSDTGSPCCKMIDDDFIERLLAANYIQKEKALAIRRINEVSNWKKRDDKEVLFGSDKTLVVRKDPLSSQASGGEEGQSAADQLALNEPENDQAYLVRFVPKAGGRTKQVHFTMDILNNYFKMELHDHLQLQLINDIYRPEPIENRKINLSSTNRNVKIEVRAAEKLNRDYPDDTDKRPILLFRRVNPTFFEYMLLLDGDAGYDLLNNYLKNIEWHGRSFAYEYMEAGKLLSIWEDCPLV